MIHLAMRMYCNWSIDHAIDHSSIGLNRLTIQLVFNEVSLFTFSEETHGFDVTVPKNYLKYLTQDYYCVHQNIIMKYSRYQKAFKQEEKRETAHGSDKHKPLWR